MGLELFERNDGKDVGLELFANKSFDLEGLEVECSRMKILEGNIEGLALLNRAVDDPAEVEVGHRVGEWTNSAEGGRGGIEMHLRDEAGRIHEFSELAPGGGRLVKA